MIFMKIHEIFKKIQKKLTRPTPLARLGLAPKKTLSDFTGWPGLGRPGSRKYWKNHDFLAFRQLGVKKTHFFNFFARSQNRPGMKFLMFSGTFGTM